MTRGPDEPFTIGVEEEYHLVDRATLALRPRADRVWPVARRTLGAQVQQELNLSQIEIATEVCRSLDEVRTELSRLRRSVAQAAEREDSRILAAGTHPFTEWLGQVITPKERYQQLEEDYQQLAREQLLCGCHVHVCVLDDDLAVQVMDRARPWLPTLIALAANSPFWEGIDTGYATYRTELFGRWPTTGTPHVLGSRAGYDRVVGDLVQAGAIPDASFLYWDIRPSTRFTTLEFRVADVCLTVDEAVMVSALSRSIVRTCYDAAERGVPVPDARPEVVHAARWQASRYGLQGELIDVLDRRRAPAAEVVHGLLDLLRPDLDEHDEWNTVTALVAATLARGNGAQRQRAAFRDGGDPRAVADFIARETVPSTV